MEHLAEHLWGAAQEECSNARDSKVLAEREGAAEVGPASQHLWQQFLVVLQGVLHENR
jgi:hypothetical protein